MRFHGTIAALTIIAAGVLATTAAAEDAPAHPPVVLEIPSIDLMPALYQVKEIDPRGIVRIDARPEFRQSPLTLTEGYYVMVIRPDRGQGETRLVRVQVNDVATAFAATLNVGGQGVAQLRPGVFFFLSRPPGSTTAMLRSLPEVVRVAEPAKAPNNDEGPARAKSILNLKKIGLALHNYHAANGHLPPAVIFGPDGKPWHSWRVLLLPYLEEKTAFLEYDFLQPWDSEKNRKVLERMPDIYRDPVHGDEKGHFTHYAALVGSVQGTSTAFPPTGMKMKDAKTSPIGQNDPDASGFQHVTDGTSNTIVAAPVSPDRKIPWTKPEDIEVGVDFPALGRPGGIAAPYHSGENPDAPRAAPVLMLDGRVLFFRDTLDLPTLRALSTRNGGEVIDPTQFPIATFRTARPEPTLIKIHLDGDKTRATVE